MHTRAGIFGAAMLAASVAAVSAAMAEPQVGGVAQRDFSGASGTRAPSGAVEYLPFGHAVYVGERVDTPYNGSTVLRFHDQTQLQVGAGSSVVLDSFVYDPDANAVSGGIRISKGIFRYVSGWATNDRGVKVSTPTATLAIRGTKFLVYVAGDGSTAVKVLDGSVDVQPCGGGEALHATSGQGVEVRPDCAAAMAAVTAMPDDPAVDDDYGVDGGEAEPGKGGGQGNGGRGQRGGGNSE